ncbi:multicopper oxidase domain-containing protein [Staphylococcus epidermidis]|uniref:multicopper oxidase domain-containing protein n=1 Tax=Staphylococcus epidermidis TaxID=1282 RepID=UPI0011A39D2D
MKHPFHIHATQFKLLSLHPHKPPKHITPKNHLISFQPPQKPKIHLLFKNTPTYIFHSHILHHQHNPIIPQIKLTN